MTIVRRIGAAVGGLLVVPLALAGIGLAVTLGLRAWRGDFVKAARGTGVLDNAALQGMLDDLGGRADNMTLVIAIVTAIGLLLYIFAGAVLGRMIGRQLRTAISSIGRSAESLLAVASQVAVATAQTAAATNESTATVEEIRQTAILAQEKTAEASELSQDLTQRCRFGSKSSTQNYGTFEQIQRDMGVVAEAIDRLISRAQSVGEIITAVNDLAEQSNLLSVNASIEAAKAGEHGRGFTVVAQEVKSLAQQSKQAVAQVRNVLSEIREASDMAVRAVEQSRGAVDTGRVEAERGIENTTAEIGIAERATEAAAQIATSSRQQLAGMEQISQAMRSINQAESQAVAGTRQVEQEVKQLQELASGLQSLVDAAVSGASRRSLPLPASA